MTTKTAPLPTILYSEVVKEFNAYEKRTVLKKLSAALANLNKQLGEAKSLLSTVQKVTFGVVGLCFAALGAVFLPLRSYKLAPNRISDVYRIGVALGEVVSFTGLAVLSLKWFLEKRLEKVQAEFDRHLEIEIIKRFSIPTLQGEHESFEIDDAIRKEKIIVDGEGARHVSYAGNVLEQWKIKQNSEPSREELKNDFFRVISRLATPAKEIGEMLENIDAAAAKAYLHLAAAAEAYNQALLEMKDPGKLDRFVIANEKFCQAIEGILPFPLSLLQQQLEEKADTDSTPSEVDA